MSQKSSPMHTHLLRNLYINSISAHGVRVLYYIKEYLPLKDSSNMTIGDWVEIALDIKDNYSRYDGFVVIHGTDTMAYSVSALSFMLENLGKSVIFTGSQVRCPTFEIFINQLVCKVRGRVCRKFCQVFSVYIFFFVHTDFSVTMVELSFDLVV